MKLLFPGSFDPITLGHMDLIERAAKIADELYVVSFDNASKHYLLPKSQRVELIKLATAHLGNVIVDVSDGLQVDYCQKHGITCVLRGLRNQLDLLYERCGDFQSSVGRSGNAVLALLAAGFPH